MIIYHTTTDQHNKKHFCAMINNTVFVPYNKSKEYVNKRAKEIEKGLNEGTFNILKECISLF